MAQKKKNNPLGGGLIGHGSIKQKVVASPVNTLVMPSTDSTFSSLASALGVVSPYVNKIADRQDKRDKQKDMLKGQKDASQNFSGTDEGAFNDDQSHAYQKAYMQTFAKKKAIIWKNNLIEEYENEEVFNKSTDSLPEFIKERLDAQLDGVEDEDYLRGFTSEAQRAIESLGSKYTNTQITNRDIQAQDAAFVIIDDILKSVDSGEMSVEEGQKRVKTFEDKGTLERTQLIPILKSAATEHSIKGKHSATLNIFGGIDGMKEVGEQRTSEHIARLQAGMTQREQKAAQGLEKENSWFEKRRILEEYRKIPIEQVEKRESFRLDNNAYFQGRFKKDVFSPKQAVSDNAASIQEVEFNDSASFTLRLLEMPGEDLSEEELFALKENIKHPEVQAKVKVAIAQKFKEISDLEAKEGQAKDIPDSFAYISSVTSNRAEIPKTVIEGFNLPFVAHNFETLQNNALLLNNMSTSQDSKHRNFASKVMQSLPNELQDKYAYINILTQRGYDETQINSTLEEYALGNIEGVTPFDVTRSKDVLNYVSTFVDKKEDVTPNFSRSMKEDIGNYVDDILKRPGFNGNVEDATEIAYRNYNTNSIPIIMADSKSMRIGNQGGSIKQEDFAYYDTTVKAFSTTFLKKGFITKEQAKDFLVIPQIERNSKGETFITFYNKEGLLLSSKDLGIKDSSLSGFKDFMIHNHLKSKEQKKNNSEEISTSSPSFGGFF